MLKLKSFFWLLTTAIIFTSCAEDEDPVGITRDDYLGVWQVSENTGWNAPQNYSVEIITGSADDEIIIEGLYNVANTQVICIVNGTALSIPSQNTEGILFSGLGSANSDFDQISLSFTADDGSGEDNVEAVLIP